MSALAFLKLRRNNSPGECTILVNNVCSRFWGIFIKHNCLAGISDAHSRHKFYCIVCIIL